MSRSIEYQTEILQLVAAGLLSRRTAIEKLEVVEDPDVEYALIEAERARGA